MLSVKIAFLLVSIALAAGEETKDFIQLTSNEANEIMSCGAHGKLITGQKTCILKCTIGCTTVGCGLFKKCEKMGPATTASTDDSTSNYASQYKCHCNFGMSAFAFGTQ